jgi:type I restriction enzyme, S subunit
VLPELVRCFADSDVGRREIEGYTATTVDNWGISASNLKLVRIPLPPRAEQHRIVERVDELMALCGRLEAAQAERERRRNAVVTGSFQRFGPSSDSSAARSRVRFALKDLHAVIGNPEHVEALRQTVLNLAVTGALVPQDGDDESASSLVERIWWEKSSSKPKRRLRPS